jgi:hypothetical protein
MQQNIPHRRARRNAPPNIIIFCEVESSSFCTKISDGGKFSWKKREEETVKRTQIISVRAYIPVPIRVRSAFGSVIIQFPFFIVNSRKILRNPANSIICRTVQYDIRYYVH